MNKTEHYVGLDVHKDTVTIAVADCARQGKVRIHSQTSSDLRAVEKPLTVLPDWKACWARWR